MNLCGAIIMVEDKGPIFHINAWDLKGNVSTCSFQCAGQKPSVMRRKGECRFQRSMS